MVERADILISHLVDGEALVDEWAELERLAAEDSGLWREIALAQRDHLALQQVVDEGVATARTVDVPAPPRKTIVGEIMNDYNPIIQSFTNRLHAWSGWALAAVVMLAFGVQFLNLENGSTPGGFPGSESQRVGFLSSLTPDETLQSYLQKGRENGSVIREIPTHVLVDTRPMPEGAGYEVIYYRRILERMIVPDLYELSGQDERGRPMLTRLRQTSRSPL